MRGWRSNGLHMRQEILIRSLHPQIHSTNNLSRRLLTPHWNPSQRSENRESPIRQELEYQTH